MTNDSKAVSTTGCNPSSQDEEEPVPPLTDSVARYRYLVNAAPLETIERATAEMLAVVSPADGERIRYWLDHFPELGVAGREDALPARLAHAEKRRPRALERAVRAGVPVRPGEDLWSVLAPAFVLTEAASAFFSQLDAAGAEGAPQTEPESDPDFSEEFGYVGGYAGGSGFENVEFDRWT